MFKKPVFALAVVITLALIFGRFINLGKYPPGLSNDETEYAVSAQSYSLTGRDVSGFGLPLSLVKSQTDGVIAPLPAVLSAPFVFGRQLNLAVARWPYAAANLITALGVFFLAFQLTKSKIAAWLSGVWFLLNPWSIYLAHNTADAPMALMFYLWAVVLALRKSGLSHIIAMIFFTLGFFSYHGAKPLLLPLTLVIGFYQLLWPDRKRYFQSAALVIFGLLLTLGFVIAALKIPGAMTLSGNKITAIPKDKISFMVNEARRQSLENKLNPVFINKYSAAGKILIQKYLNTFSPAILFISGDPRATYHFGGHGLLYYLDFVLILSGIVYLAGNFRKSLILLLLFAAVSPVSSVLSSVEFSLINRSFMLLPILVILSGCGLYNLLRKPVTAVIISILVLVSFLNFWRWWRYQYPVQNSVNYWLAERVAARYMQLENPDTRIVYVTPEPWNELVRQIFYSDSATQELYLQNFYPYSSTSSYQFKNILITPNCPDKFLSDNIYLVKSGMKTCFDSPEFKNSITDLRDSGDIIRIYNGKLCQGLSLSPWRRFNLETDFDIEKLSPAQFCTRWIFTKT